MRWLGLAGLLGACMFFGCGAHHKAENDLADLYLSTLDDKHFVWCTLDVDQCQEDFLKWKQSQQGRTIISEHEKEQLSQTDTTHEFADSIESDDINVTPTKYGPNLYPQNGKITPTQSSVVR